MGTVVTFTCTPLREATPLSPRAAVEMSWTLLRIGDLDVLQRPADDRCIRRVVDGHEIEAAVVVNDQALGDGDEEGA